MRSPEYDETLEWIRSFPKQEVGGVVQGKYQFFWEYVPARECIDVYAYWRDEFKVRGTARIPKGTSFEEGTRLAIEDGEAYEREQDSRDDAQPGTRRTEH